MKLDIGSGDNPKGEGWTTVDPFEEAEITTVMWDLPVPDHSVEAIWCSHALEHIHPADSLRTLAEWRRVLVVGGRLTVEVPDLRSACLRFAHDGEEDRRIAYRCIFGGDADGRQHLQGFDNQRLRVLLTDGGFEQPHIRRVWTYGAAALRAETISG